MWETHVLRRDVKTLHWGAVNTTQVCSDTDALHPRDLRACTLPQCQLPSPAVGTHMICESSESEGFLRKERTETLLGMVTKLAFIQHLHFSSIGLLKTQNSWTLYSTAYI